MGKTKTKFKFYLLWLVILTAISMLSLTAYGQQSSVSGRVTDMDEQPLPGATVVIKGTTQGTVTNADGNYSLSNIPENASLVFSFVGMRTQEVVVGNQASIDVVMEVEALGMDEIVVIGYGTQRRGNIAGSIATVKTEEMVAQPTADLQGMLKGKIPGLYVTLDDARPGGSSSVLLRGISSLKGGNAPLYIVDGVPIATVNELNINDIESISVLKDAASLAIYGARASNGVILINTKRGRNTNNKVNVSYSGYASFQSVNPNFELWSPEEFFQLRREAHRSDYANAENSWLGEYRPDEEIFMPMELEAMANQSFIDWQEYAFGSNVPVYKHDITASGGNEKTTYSTSLGYFYHDGVRYSSDLTRYSGRIAIDQIISDVFKTGLSAYYTTFHQNRETNSWTAFITFSPVANIYDENGELVRYPLGDGSVVNPLLYEKFRDYDYMVERSIMNGYLEITPFPLSGLKYKLNAGLDSRVRTTQNFRSFEDPASLNNGYASVDNYSSRNYLLENIISYDKIFDEKHDLQITLMQGLEEQIVRFATATGTRLANDFFGINSLASAIESSVNRGVSDRKLLSFMGRLFYGFDEKYLLNLTFRADGSSVFGANNKWGYFPSSAMAWNIHKESFMESLNWLDEAKIRISYGQVGNQAIGPYGSLAVATNYSYVSNGSTLIGYTPGNTLPNPNLKWESTTTTNSGLDFSLFEHRITGSLDYYNSLTTDLLVDRMVPASLGYTRMPVNLGEIRNRGIELVLNGFIINNHDFNWSVSGNFSKNKNTLTKGVLQNPETGEFIDDESNHWFIGESVNVYYDYKFDGIWQLDDDIANSHMPNAYPGDIRLADVSGPDGVPDGIITPDDRIVINRDPKWIGSFSTNLVFKNFEFSAQLYTVQGVIRNNPFLTTFNYGGRLDGKNNGIKRDYWTPENPSTTDYRPGWTVLPEFRGVIGYKDASYVRLRNVTFAYNLPSKWLANIGISRVKVFVAGDNLLTITDYKSYSPEGEINEYPETKNYTFGLTVNF